MKVFLHHIYEYRKGLRSLVLHTLAGTRRNCVIAKLESMRIDYQIYELSNGNINVFFGAGECVDVIRAIGKSSLSNYSAEEDFILGIMLGYDRRQQCIRYMKKSKSRTSKSVKETIPIIVKRRRQLNA